uniref:Uncharacterized protein n=1 Tax=Monopterus albus TaxID=43700 RepID=A0A3Q3IVQ3_MONAL
MSNPTFQKISMEIKYYQKLLLVLLCIIAVLMWCMTRQKGTYVTNEMDDDDNDVDNHDDESVGSNAALQIKEPLKSKDEE